MYHGSMIDVSGFSCAVAETPHNFHAIVLDEKYLPAVVALHQSAARNSQGKMIERPTDLLKSWMSDKGKTVGILQGEDLIGTAAVRFNIHESEKPSDKAFVADLENHGLDFNNVAEFVSACVKPGLDVKGIQSILIRARLAICERMKRIAVSRCAQENLGSTKNLLRGGFTITGQGSREDKTPVFNFIHNSAIKYADTGQMVPLSVGHFMGALGDKKVILPPANQNNGLFPLGYKTHQH